MSAMAFQMIDQDHNEKITKRETKAFLNGMGAMFLGDALTKMSEQEKKELVDTVFQKLDTNGDKKISKPEATAGSGFVQEIMDKLKGSEEEEDGEDDDEGKAGDEPEKKGSEL